MPPKAILDTTGVDFDNVFADRDAIYKILPHRHEFMLLDGIVHYDTTKGEIIAYRDNHEDDYWAKGHIPGRPLLPGVLMMEASAQMVGFFAMTEMPDAGFLGFGGIDNVKFRGAVVPGDRLIILGDVLEMRSRRCKANVQGFVGDSMVFQGIITGMWM